MKVKYPTDKENTQKEFSDDFHCIEKIVQFDHPEKFMKNRLIFSVCRSQKTDGCRKFFSNNQKWTHLGARLPCKNFSKIGPQLASEYKLKSDRHNLWNWK